MAHIFLLTRGFPLAPRAAASWRTMYAHSDTQTVSIVNTGHLQMNHCVRTPLESDYYCPDNPCGSIIGREVEELSIRCSHSNFLQGKEEGIQDCYRRSLDFGGSSIALSQLTLSLCSYAVSLQFPLILTSSILKIFPSSSKLSPQTALGSLPACSYPYSDGSTLNLSQLLPSFLYSAKNSI